MKITHDFHIHTGLSTCARDKENATLEKYLENAKTYGFTQMGFADHFWDDAIPGAIPWYQPQNLAHVLQLKEQLRQVKDCPAKLYFGCEVEYDPYRRDVAVTEEHAELFDFIIVPNSHTHKTMPKDLYEPYERHAEFMLQAYEDILDSQVSRYITAIAHPFQAVCCPYDYPVLMNMIRDDQYKRLFDKTAEKGIAFEINMHVFSQLTDEQICAMPQIRLFRLAKEAGCKFIFGSDAHTYKPHERYFRTEFLCDLLELKESDLAPITRL